MPTSDPGAKEYEDRLAKELARTVATRRKALNLSASELPNHQPSSAVRLANTCRRK